MKKKRRPFFAFLKWVLRIFYKKTEFVGTDSLPDGPKIIVANHAQLAGPLGFVLRFPFPACFWCTGEMMSIRDVPDYAMRDFWAYKSKRMRWFYRVLSYIIAPIFVYLCRSAEAIPVYRDRRIVSTFKMTMERLESGESVIIFPECHECYNEIINELQQGFCDVGRIYYKKYGKELCFVPLYNAPSIKKAVFGKAIRYDSTIPQAEQRALICDHLKNEITAAAKSLPAHTVTPYANIPRKNYPRSNPRSK